MASKIAAKLSERHFGKCKCCRQETYLKNMWYTTKGQKEIYGQMLIDCFDIDWMIQGNEQDDKICESCISKLRVAVSFKSQVQRSQLQSQIETIKGTMVTVVEENLKESEEESSEESVDGLLEEEESSKLNGAQKTYEDVEFLEEDELEHEKTDDDDSQDSEPAVKKTRKRSLFTNVDLEKAVEAVKTKKVTMMKAEEIFKIPRKTIRNKLYGDNEKPDIFNVKEFLIAIRALLTHTNVTPFKIRPQNYVCFFCPSQAPGFADPEDLRKHTHSAHNDKVVQIEFVIRPHYLNQMIRIDIVNLTCDCDEDVTWSEMLDHLQTRHNVDDIQNVWKKIVPYTLGNYPRRENPCALCDYAGSFNKLDTHMNIHFQNYICGECGKPFVTETRLKSHLFYHDIGENLCEICKQVFATPKARRQHINITHKKKLSFQCTVCPKRFVTDRQKYAHLRTEHQDELETKGWTCKLCAVSFWVKDYWSHMRRKHSKFICSKCTKMFENKNMLDKHVCKGGGASQTH